MFGRRKSVHGRLMGDIRSAQQKCVRRGLEEPLILLHLEHLLSTPDFSLAVMKRAYVIAAEDVGAGALGLLPKLLELSQGWKSLDQMERARRLIQVAKMMASCDVSRFVPCWVVSLLQGVDVPERRGGWRSLDALLAALKEAIAGGELQAAGLAVEEVFLRHTMGKEDDLPAPVGFSKDVIGRVWDVLEMAASREHRPVVAALRSCFGPPSRVGMESRLYLYLAVVAVVLRPDVIEVEVPEVDDDEVELWLEIARDEPFVLPDWVFDRHTQRGRRQGLSYAHFFESSVVLGNPSDILGVEREEETLAEAKRIYAASEAAYGRRAGSAHMRRRWREKAAASVALETPRWQFGLPEEDVDEGCVTEAEASALLASRAKVAQKCTGRAKKPVFLFPTKVVKGPWVLPDEYSRLSRELGCGALMRHWAMSEDEPSVLRASLYYHRENRRIYTVTPALYPAPTEAQPWEIESVSTNVSSVGPRTLEVISRASTGVVRVSDRLVEAPGYLLDAPEVWEHLIHRYLLKCGDSGFHNMLVDPVTDRAVGVDLDEMRRLTVVSDNDDQAKDDDAWMDLLFKRRPAKRLHRWMRESLALHRDHIEAILVRLDVVCEDDETARIVDLYQLSRGAWREELARLRRALAGVWDVTLTRAA